MLEADPAELAGKAETPLAEHIADCPRCGPVARRLLAGQDALAAALERSEPRVPVDEALRRARRASVARPARSWLAGSAAAGLAAAAILAVLLLTGPEGPVGEPWRGGASTRVGEMALAGVEEPAATVKAPAGRNVMVLDTGNPKVRIVWIY